MWDARCFVSKVSEKARDQKTEVRRLKSEQSGLERAGTYTRSRDHRDSGSFETANGPRLRPRTFPSADVKCPIRQRLFHVLLFPRWRMRACSGVHLRERYISEMDNVKDINSKKSERAGALKTE